MYFQYALGGTDLEGGIHFKMWYVQQEQEPLQTSSDTQFDCLGTEQCYTKESYKMIAHVIISEIMSLHLFFEMPS